MPLISAEAVRERVATVEQVATLPVTLARVLDLAQDRSSTAADLAQEIANDPALTMRVLRTVNSSYFGFNRRIETVSDAVVLLGFTEVERLALAIAVINLFGGERDRARTLNQLWRHSLATSIAADVIVKECMPDQPGTLGSYAAALLHDIGKAVITQALPEAALAIRDLVERHDYPSYDAELEVLDGISHAQIGGWLAESWLLPVGIVESILLHHEPEEAPDSKPLVHITHLANVVCHRLNIHSSKECHVIPLPSPPSCELLGLSDDTEKRIGERLERQDGLIGALAGRSL